MKKVNPKLLYLISAGCFLASIPFKNNTTIAYYGFLGLGLVAFLLAATSSMRK